ncbi:MAG: phosphate ABC transporter permease PstA [Alphaproteobacteria bacterium]
MNSADIQKCIEAGLARRHAAEMRFRWYGRAALAFAALMLGVLLVTIARPGLGGFTRHELVLRVELPSVLGPLRADPQGVDFYAVTQQALLASIPDAPQDRDARHQLYALAGFFAADDVKRALLKTAHAPTLVTPGFMEVRVPLSDIADLTLKGKIDRDAPAAQRPITDAQLHWLDEWRSQDLTRSALNRDFFTRGDSRSPEAAGFLGSIIGSLMLLAVCMMIALPVALLAAIFLEEFAPKNRFTDALEILINNLAAVPSILYGLLGLSVFLQWSGLPRSSPLVGGFTISLLILPVLIIASRAAIRAVPPSMRLAALALGASRLQATRHHVLPYALPGILTGTILSVCRAIGETAPLLMIGMVAFVADLPRTPLDPATAMPVQIYLWASSPELGYLEKTSAGILVLLAILLLLNSVAITLRRRTQKVWN